MASAARRSDASEEPLALTSHGRREVIRRTIDLPSGREPRNLQVRSLASIYGALIRREESLARLEVEPYFVAAPSTAPDQGFYASFGRWWSDRGLDDLLALPGVIETETGLRFVGAAAGDLPDGIDADDARPLEEFRSDPRVRARRVVEDRHGPTSDVTENLLDLWDRIAASSPVTSEEIERDYRLPDLDEYADRLEDLPHIERERSAVSAEDVRLDDLETLAELREAEEQIQAPPTTEWRFSPDA